MLCDLGVEVFPFVNVVGKIFSISPVVGTAGSRRLRGRIRWSGAHGRNGEFERPECVGLLYRNVF